MLSLYDSYRYCYLAPSYKLSLALQGNTGNLAAKFWKIKMYHKLNVFELKFLEEQRKQLIRKPVDTYEPYFDS